MIVFLVLCLTSFIIHDVSRIINSSLANNIQDKYFLTTNYITSYSSKFINCLTISLFIYLYGYLKNNNALGKIAYIVSVSLIILTAYRLLETTTATYLLLSNANMYSIVILLNKTLLGAYAITYIIKAIFMIKFIKNDYSKILIIPAICYFILAINGFLSYSIQFEASIFALILDTLICCLIFTGLYKKQDSNITL